MHFRYNTDHTFKTAARVHLWERIAAPAKKYLTLPGIGCSDVVDGMARGVITKNTQIVAFERDSRLVGAVESKLRELGIVDFCVYPHKFESKRADAVIREHDARGPFDLIYLDFCGELTTAMSAAIERLRSVLRRAAVTGITLYVGARGTYTHAEYKSWRHRRKLVTRQNRGYTLGFAPENAVEYYKRAELIVRRLMHGCLRRSSLHSMVVYLERNGASPMVFMTLKATAPKPDSYFQTLLRIPVHQLREMYDKETCFAHRGWIKKAIQIRAARLGRTEQPTIRQLHALRKKTADSEIQGAIDVKLRALGYDTGRAKRQPVMIKKAMEILRDNPGAVAADVARDLHCGTAVVYIARRRLEASNQIRPRILGRDRVAALIEKYPGATPGELSERAGVSLCTAYVGIRQYRKRKGLPIISRIRIAQSKVREHILAHPDEPRSVAAAALGCTVNVVNNAWAALRSAGVLPRRVTNETRAAEYLLAHPDATKEDVMAATEVGFGTVANALRMLYLSGKRSRTDMCSKNGSSKPRRRAYSPEIRQEVLEYCLAHPRDGKAKVMRATSCTDHIARVAQKAARLLQEQAVC